MLLDAWSHAILKSTFSLEIQVLQVSSRSTMSSPCGRCRARPRWRKRSWSTQCQPWWQSLAEPLDFFLDFLLSLSGTTLISWRGLWPTWDKEINKSFGRILACCSFFVSFFQLQSLRCHQKVCENFSDEKLILCKKIWDESQVQMIHLLMTVRGSPVLSNQFWLLPTTRQPIPPNPTFLHLTLHNPNITRSQIT